MQDNPIANVREYLVDLQERITSTVAMVDGGRFVVDRWTKPKGETLQVLLHDWLLCRVTP